MPGSREHSPTVVSAGLYRLDACIAFGGERGLGRGGSARAARRRSAFQPAFDSVDRYPSGAAARITAVEITLAPGQQTGWHMHPVPLFAYILEGELTVDYGGKGERTYRAGDGFMEAMDERHNGRNSGQGRVKILVVVIGEQGVQGSVPASPPAR